MISNSFFTILVALAVVSPILGKVASVSKPEVTNILRLPHYQPSEEITTCGGVLNDSSNEIVYKPFSAVPPNQRCVYIVAAPQAYSYDVRVLHFGHEPSQRLLNVARVVVGTVPVTSNIPTTTNFFRVNADALVITFQSPENGTTGGFALEYSVAETRSYTSPDSEHAVIGADTIFSKYPSQREQYDFSELGIFALPPVHNTFIAGRYRQAIYKRIQLEGCHDVVSVYKFQAGLNRYDLEGSICDDVDVELVSHDDVTLIVFRTDNSVLGRGFTLAFSSCGGSA